MTKHGRLRNAVGATLIALLVPGCATGPVNYDRPSTGDLLFRWDKLSAYLDTRRGELDTLQAQLMEVNAALSRQLETLEPAQAELRQLSRSAYVAANELAAMERDYAEVRQMARDSRTRLSTLEDRKAAAEARSLRDARGARADQQDVAAIRTEIASLGQQVAVLQAAIDRTTRSRRQALLRR